MGAIMGTPRCAGAWVRSGRAVLSVASLILTSACATDQLGLVMAEAHRADGALVVEVEGFGPTLDTGQGVPSLALGWVRRTFVYADDGRFPEGRSFLAIDLPTTTPALRDERLLGLSLRLAAPDPGVTLGYESLVVLADVPADASVGRVLTYRRGAQPPATLSTCLEAAGCEPNH